MAEAMIKTSTILEQELRSRVDKIGVGIGLHFLWVATLYLIPLNIHIFCRRVDINTI